MDFTELEMSERVHSEYDWERGYQAGVSHTMRVFRTKMDNLAKALEELRSVFDANTPDAQ